MNNTVKLRIICYAILLLTIRLFADAPSGYYNTTQGLSGNALQIALHNIIDDHNAVSYTPGVWDAFATTDLKPNGKIWDMYSSYEYTLYEDQAGNYSQEGDVYNREHSWPQSLFNEASPMKSDLFHIYPTDGYVNGWRSNYPYGETDAATRTSSNGSKLGPARRGLGYSGTVFEPIDEYKGDFARTYFYMATRYYSEDGSWSNWAMADGVELKTWAIDMLLDWHRNDQVSSKETNRNDAVYAIQNNRNPFIDHPEFVEYIWGGQTPGTLEAPLALDATEIDSISFKANWSSVSAASLYQLYVSENDEFGSFIENYGPKTTSLNNMLVSGLESGTDYYYKVKASDGDNESVFSNSIHVVTTSANTEILNIPLSFTVGAAYPNPFNPACTLPLKLDRDMSVDISLIDISGNLREEIHSAYMSAGNHRLTLDAGRLNSGIYIIRVIGAGDVHVQKVLLIK